MIVVAVVLVVYDDDNDVSSLGRLRPDVGSLS